MISYCFRSIKNAHDKRDWWYLLISASSCLCVLYFVRFILHRATKGLLCSPCGSRYSFLFIDCLLTEDCAQFILVLSIRSCSVEVWSRQFQDFLLRCLYRYLCSLWVITWLIWRYSGGVMLFVRGLMNGQLLACCALSILWWWHLLWWVCRCVGNAAFIDSGLGSACSVFRLLITIEMEPIHPASAALQPFASVAILCLDWGLLGDERRLPSTKRLLSCRRLYYENIFWWCYDSFGCSFSA